MYVFLMENFFYAGDNIGKEFRMEKLFVRIFFSRTLIT